MMHKISEKLFHHHKEDEKANKPAVVVHSEKDAHLHKDKVAAQTVVNEGVVAKETIVNAPIVEEKVRQDKIIEVQPVIHKEVEQPVVHHVEEHIVEPAAPNMGGVVRNAAIVDEHVHTQVIEEIQPIVHREVAVPRVEKVEEHITEHVVAPTVHTHEVKETIVQPTHMHVAAGGAPVHHHEHNKHL